MATIQGSWSFDTSTKTATFTSTDPTGITIKITGLNPEGADAEAKATKLNDAIDVAGDANGGTVTLKTDAFGTLSDRDVIEITDGYPWYTLVLDTTSGSKVPDKAEIDTITPYSFGAIDSDGNVAIKGNLNAYYELVSGGKTVTYHAAQTGVTLAKISGLANTTDVVFDTTDTSKIKVKMSNFTTGTDVEITSETIENLSTDSQGIIDGFVFQLVSNGDSSTNGGNLTGDGSTAGNTLGFMATANSWEVDGNSATYNSNKAEGWTLGTDKRSITYSAAEATPLATINGFAGNVSVATAAGGTSPTAYAVGDLIVENNGNHKALTVTSANNAGGNGKDYTFKILTKALGNEDLTVYKYANAPEHDTYILALDSTDGSYNSTDSTVGFGNKNGTTKYWTASGGTVTQQYDIAEGWTLESNTITHTGAETKKVIVLTGLNNVSDITGTSQTTAPTGIILGATTNADNKNQDANTVYLNSSVFKAEEDNVTASIDTTDVDVANRTYTKIALDETQTLNTALTINTTDSDYKLGTISAGKATITGDTAAWYKLGTGSDADKTITYHKAKDDVAVATLEGLAGTTGVSLDAANKTITLQDSALGTNTITLTVKNSDIAGLETEAVAADPDNGIAAVAESKFKFVLASDNTKKSEANQVNPDRDTMKISGVASGTATITGEYLPWYELTEEDKKVNYHAKTDDVPIAEITGLSSDANSSNVTFKNATDKTIVLGRGALGSTQIKLLQQTLGGSSNHGLTLAFDENDSTISEDKNSLGFEDSGNYWTVNTAETTTLQYQHNKEEGWKLTAGVAITHTDAEQPLTTFVITGLKTSSATGVEKDSAGATSTTLATGTKYSTVDDITVEDNVVTISTALLNTDTTVTTVPTGTSYVFKIKGTEAGAVAGDSVGFTEHKSEPYWRINSASGKAEYVYDTDAGWKIENGKIKYTAEKTGTTATVLATITGLKASALTGTEANKHTSVGGATPDNCYNSITGLTVGADGTITIAKGLLNETLTGTDDTKGYGNTVQLTLGDGVTAGVYKLALDSSDSTLKDITGTDYKVKDPTIGFNFTDSSGTATVKREREAGWVFADSSKQSMTFYKAVDDTLATITGLNTTVKKHSDDSATTARPTKLYIDATGGNFTEVVELDGTTVKLKKDALTTGNVTLTPGTVSTYKLALDGETGTNAAGKTTFGFEESDKYWHATAVAESGTQGQAGYIPATTTATYQMDVEEGWTLASDTSITYTGAVNTDGGTPPTPIATITGLKADLTNAALKAGITVEKDATTGFNIVTLSPDVLNQLTSSSATEVAINNSEYKLAIKGATNGVYGFDNVDGSKTYWKLATVSAAGAGAEAYNNTITATYYYDYGEGWEIKDGKIVYTAGGTKEIAKIEGLKSGFMTIDDSKKYPTVSGITVSSDGKTFKLASNVLNDNADAPTKITDIDDNDVANEYSLAFDSTSTGTDKDGNITLGFAESARKWNDVTTSGAGTASYQYNIDAGWMLNTTSNDATVKNKKITYKAAESNKTVATVTGLKTTNLQANLNNGAITIDTETPTDENKGTITIKKSVLNETLGDGVSSGNAVSTNTPNYQLAVGSDANALESETPTKALDYSAASSGTVTVKETLDAGWLANDEKNTLTYYKAVDNTLATVTGLSKEKTSKDTVKLGGDDNDTITISKDALLAGNVTLTGSGYKLALDGETGTNADGKPTFGFEESDKYWAVDGETPTTVNYQHNVTEGWTLASDTSITYSKPKEPVPENGDENKYDSPVVDVKITGTGLKSGLTDAQIASGIVVGADKKTITVSKDLFNTNATDASTINLVKSDGTATTDYALNLKDADDDKVGFEDEDPYWVISGSAGNYTATYNYKTAAGWTISGNTITYTAPVPKTIFTINGLKTATGTSLIDAAGDPIANTYSSLTGVTVEDDGTVKLADSVLGSNAISITKVTGTDLDKLNATYNKATYKLAFDGTTNEDGTFGFEDKDPYWAVEAVTGTPATTTATYKHEIGEGWTLADSTHINYTYASDADAASGTKSSTVTLATITGLKSGLTVNDAKKIDGITLDADKKTITISKDVLEDATASLDTASVNAGYKLALDATETVDGKGVKIGFENEDGAEKKWAVGEGTGEDAGKKLALYQYDVAEGWTLKDDGSQITYAPVTTKTVATIKNINSSLSATNGVISGISVDDKTGVITIDDTAIFLEPTGGSTYSTATLEMGTDIPDGTYTLAVDTDVIKTGKYVDDTKTISATYNSDGTATVSGTIKKYVVVDKDGTTVDYYKEQSGQKLATVSSLKNGQTDGVTYKSGGIIELDSRALDGVTAKVTLTREDIENNPDFILDLSTDADNGVSQTANTLKTDEANYPKVTVSNGTATIKRATEGYYSVSQDGQSVNFTASTDKTVAEITGLSADASTSNVTLGTADAQGNRVITLKKAALGTGEIALVNKKLNGETYKGLSLAFDNDELTDTTKADKTKAGFGDGDTYWSVNNGVATYKQETNAGWTLDTVNNVITYTPKETTSLATVKGLKDLKNGTYYVTKAGESPTGITGITVTPPTSPSTTTTFSIAKDLLKTTADVTVIDLVEDDKKDFALKLTTTAGSNQDELGFSGKTPATNDYYWVVDNGTVTYQYDVGEGWTAGTDGITYTGATTKTVFTIEGLTGLKNGTYKTSPSDASTLPPNLIKIGTLADNKTPVTLSKDILGNNDVKIITGDGAAANNTYTLSLGDSVTTVGGTDNTAKWFVDGSGTAKYQETKDASWTLNTAKTTINYTAAKEYDDATETYATITGLKKGVTAEELEKYIEYDPSAKAFIVHKEVLGTTAVTFTSAKNSAGTADEYTLKLGGDVSGTTTKEYWTYSGTTGTYKQDVTEGWDLVKEGTGASERATGISYTPAKAGYTLATVKGLKKGLTLFNSEDSDTPNTIEGIGVSGNNILIDDSALTTTNVTITQGKDSKNNATTYSLVYNGEHTAAKKQADWLVGGGTATFKELNTAYYTAGKSKTDLAYNDKIAYTKAVPVKVDNKEVVYAVLKGVSKTATAEDFTVTAYTPKSATDSTVATKGTITVSADALNKANITISGDYYKLALDDSIAKPKVTKSSWTLTKTTAVMKGDISGGYKASIDGRTITYTKPQTSATLLTVTGLPTGCVCKNNKIYVTSDTEAFTVNDNIVTVAEETLAKAPKKIALKGTGYEFAPLTSFESGTGTDGNYTADEYKNTYVYTSADTVIAGKDANGDGDFADSGDTRPGVDVWRVSGTTAYYKRVIPAHYELVKGVLTYVAEKDYTEKDGNTTKKFVYATVAGLAKGLTASADGKTVQDASGKDVITLTGTGTTKNQIRLEEGAIGGTKITFTPNTTGYDLDVTTGTSGSYLGNNLSASVNEVWAISGTTATLKKGTSAGWTKGTVATNGSYKYTKSGAKQSGDVLATVSGLKKGLTATNGKVAGITLTGTTIKLDNRVLPTTGTANTKVTVSSGYTLDIDKTGDYAVATAADTAGKVYSVSGTNVTVKNSTKAVWELKDGVLTYKDKEVAGTVNVTIKGLKKGLKLNANGEIDGISISGTTITVDSRALGTTDVKLENNNGGYSLALQTDATKDYAVSASATNGVWSVSGTKAIYKEVTTAGWALDSANNKIVYTKPVTSAAKATISNLQSGLKAVNGKIEGINFGGSTTAGTGDTDTSTIYLSANVLDNKTVKLTGTNSYKLALASADSSEFTSIANSGSVWTVSKTTATLKSANTAGYSSTDDKTLTYYDGTKAGSAILATITGLKNGLRVVNGGITGITVGDPVTTGTGAEATTSRTITLDSRVLGTTATEVNLDSKVSGAYKLALATTKNSDNTYAVVDSEEGFKYTVDNKTGIVTVQDGYSPKGYHLDSANNKITYNKAGKITAASGKLSDIATIEGLKSGIKADANGQIAGIKYTANTDDSTGGTFTLSQDVLGTTDVSITDKDNDTSTTYALALESGIKSPTAALTKNEWTTKDGAAVWTITSDGGYEATKSNGSLSYTDKITYTPKGTSKVVVGGLNLTGTGAPAGVSGDLATKTVTITNTNVGNTVKEVTVSDGYKLALGTTPTPEWIVNGTTASLVQKAGSDGLLCDGNTITKGSAGDTLVLATITGLSDSLTYTDLAFPAADGTITLPAAAFKDTTSTIKLTGSGYKLNIDAGKPTTTDGAWSINDTTATLAKGTTAGYTLSADGKTATYTPFSKTGNSLATVSGLKNGTKLSDLDAWTNATNKELVLTKDMLGDTKVTVTAGYKLVLDTTTGKEVPQTAEKAGSKNTWTLSGTTLTINNVANNYYKVSKDTEITAVVGKTTQIAKITGLPSGTVKNAAGKVDGITVDDINKTIKVSAEAIGTSKNISLTTPATDGYKFILANDVSVPTSGEYTWSISGTTATLKQNVSEGYTVSDGKKITYVKESSPVVATVTGLKSGLKAEAGMIDGIEFDGSTITLSEAVLAANTKTPAKLTLGTGVPAGTYTLALDRDSVDDADDVDVQNGTDVWSYDTKSLTATYKHVTPAHYTLNGNTITYTAQTAGTSLAAVTNVSNFDENMFDGDKTVTLTTNNLSGKDVSIKGDGYALELDDQVSTPVVSEAKWTQTGTTAVLKGTRTAGYTQTNEQTVKFNAEQKNQTFASIVGAKESAFADDDYVNTEDEKVYLYSNDLDENAVTVSGGFLLDFQGYNDASIAGSAGADSIVVDGSKLTISLGGGNDYIDLGSQGGNKVIYGGGNDVIADFTATGTNQDVLQLSAGSITKAVYEDGDAILTLSDGKTITLKDFTADSITYLDNKGNATTRDIASADLLESDNFMGADSELGSIVSDTDKLGDLEDTKALTDSNVTTLTKQSSLITYGKK